MNESSVWLVLISSALFVSIGRGSRQWTLGPWTFLLRVLNFKGYLSSDIEQFLKLVTQVTKSRKTRGDNCVIVYSTRRYLLLGTKLALCSKGTDIQAMRLSLWHNSLCVKRLCRPMTSPRETRDRDQRHQAYTHTICCSGSDKLSEALYSHLLLLTSMQQYQGDSLPSSMTWSLNTGATDIWDIVLFHEKLSCALHNV